MNTRNELITLAEIVSKSDDVSNEKLKNTLVLLSDYIKSIHKNPTVYLFESENIRIVNSEQGDIFLENEVEYQIDALKRLYTR